MADLLTFVAPEEGWWLHKKERVYASSFILKQARSVIIGKIPLDQNYLRVKASQHLYKLRILFYKNRDFILKLHLSLIAVGQLSRRNLLRVNINQRTQMRYQMRGDLTVDN